MSPRRYPRPLAVMDTGPLVALSVDTDSHHKACVEWLTEVIAHNGSLVIPMPVVTEVALFLERLGRSDLEALFLQELQNQPRLFKLYSPGRAELARMGELVAQYQDWPLGTPDASVVATAEHFGITTVATIDHKHFRAIRPRHVDAFVIVP